MKKEKGIFLPKKNIQSIFPFRKNIWSQDVVTKLLANQNMEQLLAMSKNIDFGKNQEKAFQTISRKVDTSFTLDQKLNILLDANVKAFNHLVFDFLKTTDYPLATEATFPLLENDEVLVRDDIFKILEESGVGVPAYYNKIEFEINGKKGEYARSRSGCFFCFFQQKIEWVWLYEQHPDLYKKAMEYEKDGYTWGQHESLEELIQPRKNGKNQRRVCKKNGKKIKSQITLPSGHLR
jgi:hypothetical protein